MTWVRLEDGFPDHPKVVGLSNGAFRAFIEALCYAGRYLTDGKIPKNAAQRIGRRWLAECAEAGLIHIEGDGFLLHDFLTYNPSREQVEEERRKARERRANAGRNGGLRSGEVRANVARSVARTNEAPTRPYVPTEHKRARAREAEIPAAPQPPRFTGRCEHCGASTPEGHAESCPNSLTAFLNERTEIGT